MDHPVALVARRAGILGVEQAGDDVERDLQDEQRDDARKTEVEGRPGTLLGTSPPKIAP